MVRQNFSEELVEKTKSRSYVWMPERTTIQRNSQLTDSIAGDACLRENRVCEVNYPALQQCVPAKRINPGTEAWQPVFKAATTGFPGWKKIAAPFEKKNVSPQKEIRMPKVAIIAPWSAEMYPRQPARSVYTSPLIANDEAALLIFEKRYKSRSIESLSARAAPKDETGSALNVKINTSYDVNRITNKITTSNRGSTVVIKDVINIAQKKVQESLPKNLNTCTGEVKKMVETFSQSTVVTSPNKSPVRIPPEDVNSCTRGVKRMVQRFSQTSPATSPNEAPEHTPPEDVNICTARRVKRMVELFSQKSMVTSPNNSSVRTSPELKKFNASQSESSNVSPPVKMPLPKPDQPATAERRDASPKVETREVLPVNSVPMLSVPAYEALEESPVNMWSYNVDNFLEDALGSQLFSQSMSSINSKFVFSDVMSLPLSASVSVRTTTADQDIFSYGFHQPRADNTVDYQRPVLQSSLSLQPSGGNNDRVNRLTMEVSIQRSLIAQTNKALYLCRTLKQFKESREMVEAERILLLGSLRCQAAQDELKTCALPPSNSASRGSITISEIVVPLKWDTFRKRNQNLCSQWLVCVLISGERVEATEVVKVVDSQLLLKFQTLMHLSDLSCNFRARLQLYVFQAPQHSNKGKCKIVRGCKMLWRPTRSCLRPAGSIEELIDFRNPAFTMIGCTELTAELIGQVQPVSCSLQEVPMFSLVKGTINFRLSAHLLKAREHSGFLNVLRPVGEENAWQRWWCHLDGRALNCWNYPVDQGEKEPVYSIDLVGRQSETIVPAPRLLCSRPRTLMLESQRWGDYSQDLESSLLVPFLDLSIARHFLSCDSTAEMAEWSVAINECIDASYLWNKTSLK